MEDYKKKYLEYKIKYIELKKSMEKKTQAGGALNKPTEDRIRYLIQNGRFTSPQWYQAYLDKKARGEDVPEIERALMRILNEIDRSSKRAEEVAARRAAYFATPEGQIEMRRIQEFRASPAGIESTARLASYSNPDIRMARESFADRIRAHSFPSIDEAIAWHAENREVYDRFTGPLPSIDDVITDLEQAVQMVRTSYADVAYYDPTETFELIVRINKATDKLQLHANAGLSRVRTAISDRDDIYGIFNEFKRRNPQWNFRMIYSD
jgi:hypothetical protein